MAEGISSGLNLFKRTVAFILHLVHYFNAGHFPSYPAKNTRMHVPWNVHRKTEGQRTTPLMHPKLSCRTVLVAVLYALVFLTSTVKAQQPEKEPRYKPRYTLWAFTASGADSNDFDINDYNINHDEAVIYVRNLKSKKTVWKLEVGFTREMAVELRMAPDKKHAALFFNDGKWQSLYWLHLPKGKLPAKWIDTDKFEKLALKACGNMDPNWEPRHFWLDFLDWDAQGRCRLKWEYNVPHQEGDTTNTGIAIVTIDSNSKPSLSLDSFLTDVDDMRKVGYGKHVTLKK